MKIKICGVTTPQDIMEVEDSAGCWLTGYSPRLKLVAKLDYVGFIFAPSQRRITLEQAMEIKKQLDPDVQTVGVFVNEDIETVVSIAKSIDLIQLHGDEDEAYIKTLKTHIHNPIIKVVRVQSTEQILDADKSIADFLLLDTYSDTNYGGIGQQFDYTLIPETAHRIFLAGGLNISNIQSAINVQSYCLDINSGVETDGFKDGDKIKDIIYKIRG